jgi:hypothetical protein
MEFTPIPQLSKTGGEISLLLLESSHIKYYAKVEDPWFKATSPKVLPSWLPLNLTDNQYYVAESPGVLGCTTIVQMCNPAEKRCYDPFSKKAKFADVWPDAKDRAIMMAYYQVLMNLFQGTVVLPQGYYTTSGLPSLITRFTLNRILQSAKIPTNRWQEEMEYIFQTNLAAAQARVVEHATGREPPIREAFATTCGKEVECSRLCHSQVSCKIHIEYWHSERPLTNQCRKLGVQITIPLASSVCSLY